MRIAEYIERDVLWRKIENILCCGGIAVLYIGDVYDAVQNTPAADVVEVVHGRWEYDFALDGSNFYRCSLCGRQEVLLEKEDIAEWCPYCHCGARMDGE